MVSQQDAQLIRPSFKALAEPHIPLVAILHVEDVTYAEPLLDALERGGIGLIEVTLRSSAALAVIERMRAVARTAVIGAGTLIRQDQFRAAKNAGAQFLVGPSFSTRLSDAAAATDLPFLPGATSPSEILAAVEVGFTELKFFPADLNGGIGWVRHMLPLFPDVGFCPTGGITNDNSADYLDQPNIIAVGGMFMAPRAEIEARAWDKIAGMTAAAVAACRRESRAERNASS